MTIKSDKHFLEFAKKQRDENWVNKVLGTNPFKMKVAVIKLGARIAFNANDTSGANGEARSIVKILETAGAEVHIFTKILKKDDLIAPFHWHNIADDHNLIYEEHFDALLVINGNVNFFGGAEDREQILNYQIINAAPCKVFYAYCDPELTLKQLWPSIEKKPWGGNWKKEHIHVTREDLIYISQPFDVDKVVEELGKNCVVPNHIEHFPFEQFPCLNEQIPACPFNELEMDLSYGGTMRGGRRIKKMIEFYFGAPKEMRVEMFGKITKEDFTEHPKYGPGLLATYKDEDYPTFGPPVKYAEMLPKMNKAMCHIVIGDPFYEQINDMAQRAYESIWSGVVTFIDHDLDSIRRVYNADKELADFLYVKSRQDAHDKIMALKKDPDMRMQIVNDQLKAINFQPRAYADWLVEILRHGHQVAAL
jgi:hypothetical protein